MMLNLSLPEIADRKAVRSLSDLAAFAPGSMRRRRCGAIDVKDVATGTGEQSGGCPERNHSAKHDRHYLSLHSFPPVCFKSLPIGR
jgi:hypothetical protein